MICRICLEPDELVSVCACRGTQGFVHKKCIQQWVDLKPSKTCELCLQPYDQTLVRIPPEPRSQTREEDKTPLYVVLITIGCLLSAVAATALCAPAVPSVIPEAFLFSLAIVYFWYTLFKEDPTWSAIATSMWAGMFLLMTGLVRMGHDERLPYHNIYAICLMMWTHILCLTRSTYRITCRINPPPNESHTEV